MKKKSLLLIGIVVFLLGAYQNYQYEENSLTVNAVITDITTKDETDEGPISYKHTYYGDYTVDGVRYTHKTLTTLHTGDHLPKYAVGDTLSVKVYPDNPGRRVPEGGVFGVVGFILMLVGGIGLYREKKYGTSATGSTQEVPQADGING